jgi:hypothetical protein
VRVLSNVVDQVEQAASPSGSGKGTPGPREGTIFLSLKRTPSRTSRTQSGVRIWCHRPRALLTNLKPIASPAARKAAPFALFVRTLAGANTLSITLVVRRCQQCPAGKRRNVSNSSQAYVTVLGCCASNLATNVSRAASASVYAYITCRSPHLRSSLWTDQSAASQPFTIAANWCNPYHMIFAPGGSGFAAVVLIAPKFRDPANGQLHRGQRIPADGR